jgi:hypothetical protein
MFEDRVIRDSFIMWKFIFCAHYQVLLGDQVNGSGRACIANVSDVKFTESFRPETGP